jgi:heme exporter protein B
LLLERENLCLHGLLLAPVDHGTIFLAKTLANFLFMVAANVVVVPIFVLFFNMDFLSTVIRVGPVLLLGLLGFSAVGTLFAAVSVRTRAREIMLPLLLLPLASRSSLPAFRQPPRCCAAARGRRSCTGSPARAFDLVFLVVGWLVFDMLCGMRVQRSDEHDAAGGWMVRAVDAVLPSSPSLRWPAPCTPYSCGCRTAFRDQ